MEKHELGLSENNLKELEKIEDKILDFRSLEKRMDFVDELVIDDQFPDELTEDQVEDIDEYLRDFVADTM